jgi:hypothetical protein
LRRRESSLIVNGLEPAVGRPDDQLFAALCSTELSVRPDVVSAKRLGRSQVGKIQPLLVYLKQADQAQQLINSAKRLRHSANPAVRDKVFINPNLTKAEAAAAFQVRSLRRQAQQRQQRALNDEDNNREGSKSSTDLGSLESSRVLRPITSDAVNAFSFNPSADVFMPSVASSDLLPVQQTSADVPTRNSIKLASALLFNARSLNNKLPELHQLLFSYKCDLICITETWFHHDLADSVILGGSHYTRFSEWTAQVPTAVGGLYTGYL